MGGSWAFLPCTRELQLVDGIAGAGSGDPGQDTRKHLTWKALWEDYRPLFPACAALELDGGVHDHCAPKPEKFGN